MSISAPNDSPVLEADHVPVALVQLDTERRISGLNSAAEAMFSLSRQSAQGRALSKLIYHDCLLYDLLDRALATGTQISSTLLAISGPALRPFTAHTAAVAALPEGGYSIALFINPVSDDLADGISGLGRFGRILGHEIKNPLAGISGAAQLLRRQVAGETEAELLNLVIDESARIARLVDKFSAFELFSVPRRARCNIHQVLEQVLRTEEAVFGDKVQFIRSFDPSLPDIFGDGDHLHEACQNIIRNAAEATQEIAAAGTVTISTRFALDRQIPNPESTATPTRAIRIAIIDNGPGISADLQKSIFDMFQTTKPNGSGLGLTIASQIVSSHDGSISLESLPGHTEFVLHLPIAKDVS